MSVQYGHSHQESMYAGTLSPPSPTSDSILVYVLLSALCCGHFSPCWVGHGHPFRLFGPPNDHPSDSVWAIACSSGQWNSKSECKAPPTPPVSLLPLQFLSPLDTPSTLRRGCGHGTVSSWSTHLANASLSPSLTSTTTVGCSCVATSLRGCSPARS